VVTFVELAPDGDRPDDEQLRDEQLRGRRIRTPAWVSRVPYLALMAVLVGAVLAGDGTSLVRPLAAPTPTPAAGYVYADRGHCPRTVSCNVLDQARIDMWASYNHLFPDTQTIASSVWYAPATGIVYYQELDAISPSGETIILVQQRISGPDVPFGPTIDRTPSPRHGALVSARRGPWLVTAAMNAPHGVPPVMAAVSWVANSPLPG
jgi:hypothetical protein